jgi:hypothetical protein
MTLQGSHAAVIGEPHVEGVITIYTRECEDVTDLRHVLWGTIYYITVLFFDVKNVQIDGK